MGKDADQVASFFDGRPRGGDNADSQFCGDDMGESGFSQSWWGMKKNMVQRFSTFFGCLDGNFQCLHHLFLADVFRKVTRPQIEVVFNFWLNLLNLLFWIRFFPLFGFFHLLLPLPWKKTLVQ